VHSRRSRKGPFFVGPMSTLELLLSGLPKESPNVLLTNATVTIGDQTIDISKAISLDAAGDPVLTISQTLLANVAKGASISVTFYFNETAPSFINYAPLLFSDPFTDSANSL
jgi:hypothetical protein